MHPEFLSSHIELVIKISKYCNLRCSYCYEFPELGNRAAMSMAQIETLFRNLASFSPAPPRRQDTTEDDFSFIWHGGEPFMVSLTTFDKIGALQKACIPARVSYHNSVQTNLTILTDRHLEHLREKRFFQKVGFSFDVYGEQRLDGRGGSSTDRVLHNIEKLRNQGIETGAITVLSRSTRPHIRNIFSFYNALGLSFRILPYHIERFDEQTAVNGLHPDEIALALCEVFDDWLVSDDPVTVYPLDTYLNNAIAHLTEYCYTPFDKWTDESIFIVNTTGDVFGYESYGGSEPYGNLFSQTFNDVIYSESRRQLAARSAERVERYCGPCRFFGACSGYPVAEANPMEEAWLESNGCYVAKVIGHIVERLQQTGLSATDLPHLWSDGTRVQEAPVVAVGRD